MRRSRDGNIRCRVQQKGAEFTHHDSQGVEQPFNCWDPVIAPSGTDFYDGQMFPEWQDDAPIGGLQAQALVRLDIQSGEVMGKARHRPGVRDVAVASDGPGMLLVGGTLLRVCCQQ